MTSRPRLLFVSPRFLFPEDSGGKIRTAQVLRGMKDGPFDITLTSPLPQSSLEPFTRSLEEVSDRFEGWRTEGSIPSSLRKLRALYHSLPYSVVLDRSRSGRRIVGKLLDEKPDLVVFDFPHSAVLGPPNGYRPSVVFTHNVEAEILVRHASLARSPLLRRIWTSQYRKMVRYEREVLRRSSSVVAVSPRDATFFRETWGLENVHTIPTGVDLTRFPYTPPDQGHRVVFMGAMDWRANVDAVSFFLESVWPSIARRIPIADMTVVGRRPPQPLVERARDLGYRWRFTGFVDGVLPHIRGANVFVIPLRVGSGTRIKAFEAMATGIPVVSTTIGVEGLELRPGEHFLLADDAPGFADAVVTLLSDHDLQQRLSRSARSHVEAHASSAVAARAFQDICLRTLGAGRPVPA